MIVNKGLCTGDEFDYVFSDLQSETPKKKTRNRYYIDNKKLSSELVEWLETLKTKPDTRMPEYIGECILKLANGMARANRFREYTYIDEMVGDAIINCLLYIKNFDYQTPTRSGEVNAFGYINQGIGNIFLQRIAKEKHQQAIKYSVMSELGKDEILGETTTNSYEVDGVFENMVSKVYEYDDYLNKRKKTKHEKREDGIMWDNNTI